MQGNAMPVGANRGVDALVTDGGRRWTYAPRSDARRAAPRPMRPRRGAVLLRLLLVALSLGAGLGGALAYLRYMPKTYVAEAVLRRDREAAGGQTPAAIVARAEAAALSEAALPAVAANLRWVILRELPADGDRNLDQALANLPARMNLQASIGRAEARERLLHRLSLQTLALALTDLKPAADLADEMAFPVAGDRYVEALRALLPATEQSEATVPAIRRHAIADLTARVEAGTLTVDQRALLMQEIHAYPLLARLGLERAALVGEGARAAAPWIDSFRQHLSLSPWSGDRLTVRYEGAGVTPETTRVRDVARTAAAMIQAAQGHEARRELLAEAETSRAALEMAKRHLDATRAQPAAGGAALKRAEAVLDRIREMGRLSAHPLLLPADWRDAFAFSPKAAARVEALAAELDALSALDQEIEAVQAEGRSRHEALERLQAEPVVVETVRERKGPTPEMVALERQIWELERERGKLLQRVTKAHPKVRALGKEIGGLQHELAELSCAPKVPPERLVETRKDPRLPDLRRDLTSTLARLEGLKAKRRSLRGRLDGLVAISTRELSQRAADDKQARVQEAEAKLQAARDALAHVASRLKQGAAAMAPLQPYRAAVRLPGYIHPPREGVVGIGVAAGVVLAWLLLLATRAGGDATTVISAPGARAASTPPELPLLGTIPPLESVGEMETAG